LDIEERFARHPYYYFGTKFEHNRGCGDSAWGAAVGTIPLGITAKAVKARFDLGDYFGIGAAAMSDTVFLALMHVAIALTCFFSELHLDNSY
jgi:hypothetical protein